MSSQNSRDFEFKLGKLGLVLFTFGIALLLLCSFLFGVMVGKNIESYPEKIAKGIPQAIKETMVDAPHQAISNMVKENETKESGEAEEKKKKDDFKVTFFDKLTEKDKKTVHDLPGETAASKVKKETRMLSKDCYMIQLASFRDKTKMEALQKKLSAMGYTPRIDEINLASRGTWYRVILDGYPNTNEADKIKILLEKNIRGLNCMIIHHRK
ncbi:MAG: SPOR domain-containing protein [Deltaproteobacteria bacterium]|nr:SPOR domain-containing protein [Deltaproteobacteria bacterium]